MTRAAPYIGRMVAPVVIPLSERLIRTKHLDLVASTLTHIEAELERPGALAALLGVPIANGWPPGEYDRPALEYFRKQLQAGGAEGTGWYGWYAMTRGQDGNRISLVAAAGYLGPRTRAEPRTPEAGIAHCA